LKKSDPKMPPKDSSEVSQLLTQLHGANRARISEKLIPLIYDDLHALAVRFLRRERKGHTLDPTALVNEAYLRLVDQSRADFHGRSHFYAVCAEIMRRILIDHARGRRRAKRGGDWRRVYLENAASELAAENLDVVELEDVLNRLAELDARQAEVVRLRIYTGMSMEEIAEVLGVSKRTVEGDWTHAKAWLRVQMGRGSEQRPRRDPRANVAGKGTRKDSRTGHQ